MDFNDQINGLNFHYRVSGDGDPLILMHGWGCNASTVASIEKTAAQTHRVFNIDFPGFGSSTEPTEVWGIEQYTSFIEEFARLKGIVNPVLIGHSFGGRVGILYASRQPVSKLILVDAAGVKPKRSMKYYFRVYSFKTAKWIAYHTMPRAKADVIVDRWRAKRGSSDYSQSSTMMRSILSRVVNEDLCHVMKDIKAPTLLIWGENDNATPLADAKKMEKLIPGAALVSFPGCGHYSFLDNPIQFSAVLASFLQS
jgi:pimeloyl-ACP methyl ester carboxylesterase